MTSLLLAAWLAAPAIADDTPSTSAPMLVLASPRTRLPPTRREKAGIATTAAGLACLTMAGIDLAFTFRNEVLPESMMSESLGQVGGLLAGELLGVAGLVTVGVGGGLWGSGVRQRVAVAVAPTPDGATLVVGGRF